MKSVLQFSDLKILFQVFFPAHLPVEVHDPHRMITFGQGEEPQQKKDVQPSQRIFVNAAKGNWKHKLDLSPPEFIMDFSGESADIPGYHSTKFYYRAYRNGTIRWVYPAYSEFPKFLGFYHETDWKSMLFASYVHLVFLFGMGWLLSRKSFLVYSKSKLAVENLLERFDHEGFSIFFENYGLNRRVTIEINKRGLSTHFAKVATNGVMESLIENEERTLKHLNELDLTKMRVPQVITGVKALRNITIYGGDQMSSLSQVHMEAIEELANKTVGHHFLETSEYAQKIRNRINSLPETHRNDTIMALCLKLKLLNDTVLNIPEAVPFSLAHNDFTPYNIYVEEGRLDVYNWELSGQAPLLSDLFHFVIQSQVFLKKADFNTVRMELKHLFNHPVTQSMVRTHGINLVQHFHLYLLESISGYMVEYVKKEQFPIQIKWMLAVWNEFLDEMMGRLLYNKNFGQIFAKDLFHMLKDRNYALLGWEHRKLNQLETTDEIEVLISESDYVRAENYVKNFHMVDRLHIQLHSHQSIWEIYFKDSSFLRIVFNYRLMHGSLQVIDHKVILKEAETNIEQLKIVPSIYHFEILFVKSKLAGHGFLPNDRTYFDSLSPDLQNRIVSYIADTYHIAANDLAQLMAENQTLGEVVKFVVRSQGFNNIFNRLTNWMVQYNDMVFNLLDSKRLMICVEGMELSGKHQVINNLQEILEQKYKKRTVVLRHKLNAENGNNIFISMIQSFLFGNWNLVKDYFNVLIYKAKGYIVIYESSKQFKSNLDGNRIDLNGWAPYVLKPDLNILLYSSASEVVKELRNVSESEINEFTSSYLDYFNGMAKRYKESRFVSIHHVHVSETLANIEKEYISVA